MQRLFNKLVKNVKIDTRDKKDQMFAKPGSCRVQRKDAFVVSKGFFVGLEEYMEGRKKCLYTFEVISKEVVVYAVKMEVG